MANVDRPSGARPYQSLSGAEIRVRYYQKEVGAARIFKQDLVQSVTGGSVEVIETSDADTLGVSARDHAASTALANFPVYDDPMIVYIMQHDGTSALTGVFGNYPVTVTTGDTVTGLSKHEIDTSDLATTAALPIKDLGLAPDSSVDGNAYGANSDNLCIINSHILKSDGSAGLA